MKDKINDKNVEFSITFGIRTAQNPAWNLIDSEVKFPPFTLTGGIQVYVMKIQKFLKIYILHPELGYRKLVSDISDFIAKDTFVAITTKGTITKLYLNAILISTVKFDKEKNNIEIGDFVLVKIKNGDLKSIVINGDIEIVLVAEIKSINTDNLKLLFIDCNEIASLNKDKLIHF